MSGEGRRVIKIRPSSMSSRETERLIVDIISQGGSANGVSRAASPIRFVEKRTNASGSVSVDGESSSSSSGKPELNKRHTFSLNPTVSLSQMCEQVTADLKSTDVATMELALQLMVNLASQASNHVFLIFNNAIPSLVGFLSHENEIYRMYATLALGNLSQTESNQVLIAGGDGLEQIVALLQSQTPDVITKAVSLLINLSGNPEIHPQFEALNVLQKLVSNPITLSSPEFCVPSIHLVQNLLHLESTQKWLVFQDGLRVFVDCAKKFQESNEIQGDVAVIILNLSFNDAYHSKMIDAGAIHTSRRHLVSSDLVISQNGYRTIVNFSSNPATHEWMWESGAPASMVSLTSNDNNDAVEHALICLFNLAIKDANVDRLVKLGVIPIAASLSRSPVDEIQNRALKIISSLSGNKGARFRLEELHVVPRAPEGRVAKVSVDEIRAQPVQSESASEDQAIITHQKNQAHRLHVIMEIIETEKSYVEHLLIVKTFFLEPLRTTHSGILSDQQVKVIFSTIEIICNLHVMFLQAIEHANKESSGELFIADPFLNMADSLRLYRTYVSDYDFSIQALSECLDRPKFRKFVETQEQTFNTLKLSSLLITPIQRIPRYVLLLKDLIKHMTPEHPDYDNLNRALDKVLDVADYLDHERAKAESVNKVLAIQEKLSGLKMKLVEPARTFIKEGSIIVDKSDQGGSSLHCGYLFLFSDLLLECTQKASGRFKVQNTFDLGDIKIVPLPPETKPNAFRVLSKLGEAHTTFSTSSKTEVEAWIGAFQTAIFNLKKSDMQRRVLSENRRMALE